jgi:transcriptional antiterminator NusG
LGKPAVIRDSEIDAIKQITDEYNNIRLEKAQIRINDDEDGSFDVAKEYNHLIALKNKSVKVELSSLGFLMVAEMETKNAGIMEESISPRIKLSYFKYAFK